MDHIKEIGRRLVALREAMELTPELMAARCGIAPEVYLRIESGDSDIAMSTLQRIADSCEVELPALLFGDEPRMKTYFVTRKGKGEIVERSRSYRYQSLAAGFAGRDGDPFLVTVYPLGQGAPAPVLASHSGQEFNYVLSGSLLLEIAGKSISLEPGDSIYFDAMQTHRAFAVGNEPVVFLAIIF